MNEKILIVDDDKIILDGFKKLLTKGGYIITTSDSGENALELIKKNSFDLILTDIVLKEMNGIELLKEVKTLSPQTVVIMITGYASIETAVKALRFGAEDYIIKPCQGDELKFRIKNALEKQKLYYELVRKDTQLVMYDLTQGLADTINNRMTTVQGFVEFAIACFEEGKEKEGLSSLLKAQDSIKRVNEVVEKLIQYTFTSNLEEKVNTDILKLCKDVENQFNEIKFNFKFPENIPQFYLTYKFSEAITEIIRNAVEANSDIINISAEINKNTRKLILNFSDNGNGIEKKDISKVFVPFFKTKATAHSGLGLWKVYQIVSANNGEVDITSQIGIGTTLTIKLPLPENQ
ncbi:hypothetical protein DRQ09_08555 [candidate division KSB1 bacterium]|nr:MAG: hypothetical protein DRQ09_08555 [candidate division KSB1 bacterium]